MRPELSHLTHAVAVPNVRAPHDSPRGAPRPWSSTVRAAATWGVTASRAAPCCPPGVSLPTQGQFSPTAIALGSLATRTQIAARTGSHSYVRIQSGYPTMYTACPLPLLIPLAPPCPAPILADALESPRPSSACAHRSARALLGTIPCTHPVGPQLLGLSSSGGESAQLHRLSESDADTYV